MATKGDLDEVSEQGKPEWREQLVVWAKHALVVGGGFSEMAQHIHAALSALEAAEARERQAREALEAERLEVERLLCPCRTWTDAEKCPRHRKLALAPTPASEPVHRLQAEGGALMLCRRQGRTLREALSRARVAGPAVGELAFWSKTVIVDRLDRNMVCDALAKILHEHPELVPMEDRES